MALTQVREIAKRNAVEELLRRNDETLRLLVGGVKDYAILLLDPQGLITTWNEGGERIKGYSPEEVVGKHFSIFYPAEDVARGKPAHELEIAAKEGRFEEEGWRVRKDGTRFLANDILTALRDDTGALRGFGKVTRDITVRKAAEESVRQSEEALRLLVGGVKDYAILMLDPQGRITTWNEGAERIKGYRATEILGEHFSIFYPPEDVADGKPARELDIAIHEGRFEEEGWRVHKDGTRFVANVILTALRDDTGALRGFGRVTRDITVRKAAEESSRSHDETMRLLVDGVKDYAILMLDPLGHITAWNAGAERIKGYRAEEIIGKHFSVFYPVEEIAAGTPDRALEIAAKEGRFEEEGWRIRKDGSRFIANAIVTALWNDAGKLLGFGKVMRDITEKKAAQEHLLQMALELERSEAIDQGRQREMQIKEEFLSHVSHELRSPLTSIYSFSTLIVDGLAGEIAPQQEEFLRIIMRNVQQLLAMIEDLLQDSQLQTGTLHVDLQPASIREAIEYAVATARGASDIKDIAISFQVSEDLPPAYADPMRLRQILTILLDNAVKFTPRGGEIHAGAAVSDSFPGFLLVEVSDTGCGIGPELTERVFERLYQASDPGQAGRRGLGLGLHIAKGLVKRLGGNIWVVSVAGKGSRFFFTMPIFSLAKLIAPVLLREEATGEAIALFTVEICAREGAEDASIEVMAEARKLLQECLRPDSDLLLPVLGVCVNRQPLFVVARTPSHGAAVLSARIKKYLEGTEVLRQSDLTVAVTSRFLTAAPKEEAESMDQFADRVAAELWDCIGANHRRGASQNDPKEDSGSG